MIQVAGGVVWNPKLGIAVVSQPHNTWSLPKGHVEPGEDTLAAAIREIREETGIPETELSFVKMLGAYERNRTPLHPDDPPEPRMITLYLFTTVRESFAPEDPDNAEARWVPIDEVERLLTHTKDREFFRSIKAGLVSTAIHHSAGVAAFLQVNSGVDK